MKRKCIAGIIALLLALLPAVLGSCGDKTGPDPAGSDPALTDAQSLPGNDGESGTPESTEKPDAPDEPDDPDDPDEPDVTSGEGTPEEPPLPDDGYTKNY